jgi:outer membrane protein TolC
MWKSDYRTTPMRRYYLPLLCCALSACAGYQAKPLPAASSLQDQIPHLVVDARSLPFPELAAHPFEPSDGLDMTELATLAVLNNPELKIARDDAGIARAQAFSAGLLPDPQLALSRDLSNSAGPGSTKAFSYGLSYDIGALISHSATSSAAKSEAKKTDLNLLWQEWQVVSQARLLYIKLMQGQKSRVILEENRAMFADRLRRTQLALEKGLLTNDVVTPNLTALQDVQKQLDDLERQTNQNRHELNALLGLKPEVPVPLQDSTMPAALDDAAVLAALAGLPHRRPDLLALEAGYQAQDQRYRAALLAQFPALNIGLTHARDSSGIYSNGVGLTLTLPILNRNRGNIAIEQATRQKLYDEYQQRLNTANSDIHKILADQRINIRQLQDMQAGISQLAAAAKQTEQAFRQKNVDALNYANVHATLLAKRIEELNLQQAILEQRVSLQTLIGGDLPVATSYESGNP